MKYAKSILRLMFWMAVASIPLAIDYEVRDFMVNQCMPGSQCLAMVAPLIVQIGLIGWATRVLLWPIAAWHLGGSWIWRRLSGGRSTRAAFEKEGNA